MDGAFRLPRPHDLLFLRRHDAFTPWAEGGLPDWLDAAWMMQAPLVARRALAGSGRAPAGARGLARKQRCAGEVALDAVARRVTPEQLAASLTAGAGAGRMAEGASTLPCIAVLLALVPRLSGLGLDWGPAGGVGFWLASGLPVLRPGSDLDLLVRVPRPPAHATLIALGALQDESACRIDIQLDTGAGGFALNEYQRESARGGKVLLKTATGPLLLADPWDAPATRAAA
ncbi:malonate decarboxylase holo-ACP synthase [Massilia sp. 9096]|uniref:malonate decarboxylase holo-ACP synthase n=1 Tax=Massilia sp. 9096 TaxID=1500894 RepID=UPI000566E4CC|nr:malonate decarboxylase holo-ACP synthase [Massilia sp. 9096]